MTAVSVALLIAWVLIPRLRRRSAAERHLAWAACLGTATVLPLLTILSPSLLPSWQPEWARQAMDALTPAFVSQPWTERADADIVVRAIGVENQAMTVGGYVALLWSLGAALMVATVAAQAWKLARLASAAERVTDGRLGRIAGDTAHALRITRDVRLLSSARGSVPMTWGVRRPRVLLPVSATGWSDERLRVVLAHELAHVRRGDWLVQMAAELACALYWMHPLFWVARHQLRRESELAADDVVLSLGIDGSDYATHLLDIVRTTRAPLSWSPTVAMARPSHLGRRFAALLSAGQNRRGVTWRRALAVVGITMLLTLPLAAALGGRGVSINIEVRTDNLPDIAGPGGTGEARGAGGSSVSGFAREVRVAGSAATTTPPKVVEYTTPPLYSAEARAAGLEGVVTVEARVDADGTLHDLRIVKGLGGGLDQNALIAVRQWRFRGGLQNGVPAPMPAEIDVEFSLRNEALNELIANDMATRVGPGVTPPRAIRASALWRRGITKRGTVVLDVILLEDGTPRIVRILKSLDPELDEGAIRNFEQWRFSPAMKDGKPVKVRMNAEVKFR